MSAHKDDRYIDTVLNMLPTVHSHMATGGLTLLGSSTAKNRARSAIGANAFLVIVRGCLHHSLHSHFGPSSYIHHAAGLDSQPCFKFMADLFQVSRQVGAAFQYDLI